MRTPIWRESYREHAEALAEWATRTSVMDVPATDGNFPRFGWRKIFPEDDHQEHAVLEE